MGGHGGAKGNMNNIQETDADMQSKIQLIDTIKHSPNHFHMEALDPVNWYAILGGAQSMAFGATGALLSYAYYTGAASKNFYTFSHSGMLRVAFGASMGLGLGYLRFGDRQRLHNAWVAERLRRRYPECMQLAHHADSLWQLKGVHAPHDFYKWM